MATYLDAMFNTSSRFHLIPFSPPRIEQSCFQVFYCPHSPSTYHNFSQLTAITCFQNSSLPSPTLSQQRWRKSTCPVRKSRHVRPCRITSFTRDKKTNFATLISRHCTRDDDSRFNLSDVQKKTSNELRAHDCSLLTRIDRFRLRLLECGIAPMMNSG